MGENLMCKSQAAGSQDTLGALISINSIMFIGVAFTELSFVVWMPYKAVYIINFYLIGIFLAQVDCMPAEMMALELIMESIFRLPYLI